MNQRDAAMNVQDVEVVKTVLEQATRLARVVRADAESVTPDTAKELNKLAEYIERGVKNLAQAA